MTESARRTALVTGASRGIGAACARRLAADGFDVLVHYNARRDRAEAVASEIGGTVVHADLSQPNGGQTLASRLSRPIDVLVNNAGVFESGIIGDVTDRQFEDVLNVNVRAVFYLTREVTRTMPDGGRIVTIGSVGGKAAQFVGNSIYSMSKFAIRGLSAGWARDLGPRGITSNVVQPGPVDTDLNPATGDHSAGQVALTSIGRYATADEVAAAVSFLCSSEAAYITGAELDVAGGWGV
ncbi:MAG: SDR family oxidoreductase [Planctomycetota bacterium]